MAYKILFTKSFNSNLRSVLKDNKKAAQAARAAMTEACTEGCIVSLPRTKNGESRIPNVEKFDLPEAYRLVVQLVDGAKKTRAFLFIGSHDDAEHWLETHKNYKWVRDKKDGVLEFIQVTVREDERYVPADRLNLEVAEELNDNPLLENLSDIDWEKLSIDSTGKDYALSISGSKFEQNADDILKRLDEILGYEKCTIIFDLMWHAHSQEWEEFKQRLKVLHQQAQTLDSEAMESLSDIESTDSVITFDDNDLLQNFFLMNTFADWMLFLHPDQKTVVERDFRGPARLRGVSGSGKTSVLVHRARKLAKKYNQPILLVTLTESMRKLLERLADDLCGIERSLIETKTMGMLAKDNYAAFCNGITPVMATGDQQLEIVKEIASSLSKHPFWQDSIFKTTNYSIMFKFLQDEISYVRGRLSEASLNKYTDPKAFQRSGRGTPLDNAERKIMFDAITNYIQELHALSLYDHEGLVSYVTESLITNEKTNGKYRCVLADEVQDLSELDILLIGSLKTPSGEKVSDVENGLFLAGDGAQSIYKRGFSLRRIGINIVGRSFNLKKNYRNTYEILNAAFGLIKEYEFSDVGDDAKTRPFIPDFAARHGMKPLIIRCETIAEEAAMVASDIASLLEMGQIPGQICVIGTSVKVREEVTLQLQNRNIPFAELKHDVDYEGNHIKISTIESAKGHEFSTVYIMGLVEGLLPLSSPIDEDVTKDASRLYVAMTRAREKLTMSYSSNMEVSRFLRVIQPDCREAFIRNGELRRVYET